jgi:DNA polymerase-3 subunit delta'
VIDDADSMTVSAQNKLLKTLEEPPGPAVILLLSERKEGLLETIRSRCILFQLQDDTGAVDEACIGAAQSIIELCRINGPFYRRAALLEPFLGERERCLDLLDAMEDQLRNHFLAPFGVEAHLSGIAEGPALTEKDWPLPKVRQAIMEVEKARKSLKMGYHIGYTMKNLCLCMDVPRLREDRLWQK